MNLETIELTNYRNYDRLTLSFSNSVNIFLGENAQGKTNLLEAISVLALAKSARTNHDKELIKWDQDYGKIKGRISRSGSSLPLEVIISKKGKKVKANHLEKRRLSEYIGLCNAVTFAPEDLALIKGSPAQRRLFIDRELSQIAPVYVYSLSQYQKVLQQRNALLRNYLVHPAGKDSFLEILTEKLFVLAAAIVGKRIQFIRKLNDWSKPIHAAITDNRETLSLNYYSAIPGVSDEDDSSKIVRAYENSYEKLKQREIDRGTTLIGPHRDDLQFRVNTFDVQTYGSQGQQRTAALSAKLAEIELIRHEVGEYPLLLLDDVLSELDDLRKTHLLGAFKEKVQTFVTTTSVDGLDPQLIDRARLFQIHQGKVKTLKM